MARWNDVALSPSLWQALGREAEAQRSFRKSEALQREKARASGGAGAGPGAGAGAEAGAGAGASAGAKAGAGPKAGAPPAAPCDEVRFTDLTGGDDPLSWVVNIHRRLGGTNGQIEVEEVQAIVVSGGGDALEKKAAQLSLRGKHAHAAACRLRVAAATFASYAFTQQGQTKRQWARGGQASAWALVQTARGICEDVASAASDRSDTALAVRAWQLALPFDSDGTKPDDSDGPHDLPKIHCNVGLACRDARRWREAREHFGTAADRFLRPLPHAHTRAHAYVHVHARVCMRMHACACQVGGAPHTRWMHPLLCTGATPTRCYTYYGYTYYGYNYYGTGTTLTRCSSWRASSSKG